MKCEIIKDLIPLVEDDVCSPQSKEAVLEHIQTCAACREVYEKIKIQPVFKVSADEETARKSLRKGFRKVKRRWAFSLVIVLCLVPIALLTWGQFSGRGMSFTNLNKIRIADTFLRDLKKGNYEAAFKHVNINSIKAEWLKDWFDEETLANIEEDAQRVFCESASLLIDNGGITDYHFLAIDEQDDSYMLYYTVIVNGEKQELLLNVDDEGVEYFSSNGSFIDDPLAHFGAWSEYLWEEYKGCYFDPETKQYVYDN